MDKIVGYVNKKIYQMNDCEIGVLVNEYVNNLSGNETLNQ